MIIFQIIWLYFLYIYIYISDYISYIYITLLYIYDYILYIMCIFNIYIHILLKIVKKLWSWVWIVNVSLVTFGLVLLCKSSHWDPYFSKHVIRFSGTGSPTFRNEIGSSWVTSARLPIIIVVVTPFWIFGGSFMNSQCISMFMDDVGARLKTPQFWQFLWRENDLCNHNESVDLECCFQLIFQTKPYGENMVIIMVFIWEIIPKWPYFRLIWPTNLK